MCSENGQIRLTGIELHREVQVCINGRWNRISADGSWNDKHASIICRELGYSPHG